MPDLKQIREALEFYAKPGDYISPLTGGLGKLYFDCGNEAKKALTHLDAIENQLKALSENEESMRQTNAALIKRLENQPTESDVDAIVALEKENASFRSQIIGLQKAHAKKDSKTCKLRKLLKGVQSDWIL